MAKAIPILPDGEWYWLWYRACGAHVYNHDPFEPGAFHGIGVYDYHGVPGGGFGISTNEDPVRIAQVVQLMLAYPELCADICVTCRGHAYGPTIPRLNIMRGQSHLPRGWPGYEATPRILPCLPWVWGEDFPPGFGW